MSTAALKALETVAPELYEQFAVICVDADYGNRLRAVAHIGSMGARGQPAVPYLITCLGEEAQGRPSPPTYGFAANAQMLSALLAAVRGIKDESPETLNAFGVFAGPGCVNPRLRHDAIIFLRDWAGEEGERRAVVAPIVMAAINDPTCQTMCIKTAGTYGALCVKALPTLRALKLSPSAEMRKLATEVIAAIEAAE